jgi:hypothetical protein
LTSTVERMLVTQVPPEDIHHAVTVLCDAFRDYPVMRYVLGIYDRGGTLAATALVTLPGERRVPEALSRQRESVWKELGPAERERYEGFGNACAQFGVDSPHHHLNMIGVRRSQ